MVKKKNDAGVAALVDEPEPISIQDIRMLDWYAAFAMIGASNMASPDEAAKEAFNRAAAMMKEREKYI